jgi:N-acyl homoserine lactone hydrolase
MRRVLHALLAVAGLVGGLAASAQPAPEVTVTRLDCGNGFNDQRRFSDTFAYSDPKVPFTFSCYVIRHGDDYMVWDTGYLPGSNPNAPKVTLLEQLGQLKISADQVKFAGVSHFHADHTGQLPSLPNAMLLIGEREWAELTAPKPMTGANVAGFAHWISGGGKLETQAADKDVFDDGTVHLHENYESNNVPAFNYDRAETLASLARIRQIQKNLKGTVIIQHDPRDVGKLPTFPAAAG